MLEEDPRGTGSSNAEIESNLARYAEMLRGSPHNLLSPRGLEELETRHFPESLAFAASLPRGRRVLDIGSGGGLPGIVIAIARPDLRVELLEATGKKAAFLGDVSDTLGIGVRVHHGRAESLANGPLASQFDIVTARAVAPLERLVPWAVPFMARGGTLHAIKGERWPSELAAAASSIGRHGLTVIGRPEAGPSKAEMGRPTVIVLRRTR